MRFISACVGFVLCFHLLTFASGKRIAIVVGVGKYNSDTGLATLSADNDAKVVGTLLNDEGWKVHVIRDGTPSLPDREQIMSEIGVTSANGRFNYGSSPLLRDLDTGDTVLFYFSGHGLKNDDGVDYLIPRNAFLTDGLFAKKSLISVNVVQTALLKSGAGSVILITDACRTIGSTKSTGSRLKPWSRSAIAIADSGEGALKINQSVHVYWLFSSFDTESLEMRLGKNGVFSYYLAQALSPAGKNAARKHNRDCLTLTDWFEYARTNTLSYVNETYGVTQEPVPLTNSQQWADSYCLAAPAKDAGSYSALREALEGNWDNWWLRSNAGTKIKLTLLRLDDCVLSWREERRLQNDGNKWEYTVDLSQIEPYLVSGYQSSVSITANVGTPIESKKWSQTFRQGTTEPISEVPKNEAQMQFATLWFPRDIGVEVAEPLIKVVTACHAR